MESFFCSLKLTEFAVEISSSPTILDKFFELLLRHSPFAP